MKRPEDAIRAPTEHPSQRDPASRRAAGGSALARMLPMGLLAVIALLAACNLDNPGVTAPEGTLAYPVAVALSRGEQGDAGADYLYVANSNFDLSFSTGSVQSYDLNELERKLREQDCRNLERTVMLDGGVLTVTDETFGGSTAGDAGVLLDGGVAAAGGPSDYATPSGYGNPRGVLCDGRDREDWRLLDAGAIPRGSEALALRPASKCCFDEGNALGEIRKSERKIDSFASGIGVSPNGERVYVPISSRAALLYLDTMPDGGLDCGGETGRCRRGPNPKSENYDPTDDELAFPGQPASMLIGTLDQLSPDGDAVASDGGVLRGQTFIATGHELGGFGLFVERGAGGPLLRGAFNGLPQRPTSVVLSPAEKVLYVANAGEVSSLSRIGVRLDKGPDESGLLYRTSPVTLTGLAQARDLRDVAFDTRADTPTGPRPLYSKRIYALVRGQQESVAFLERDSTETANARLSAAVRVGAGPSKLAFIELDGRAFLLVTCYDARSVFVIDADLRQLVAVVRNLAGPYTMAFDKARRLLYVADFRASVVRVVDLAGLTNKREPPPRIIATLGLPRFQGGLR